MGIFPVNLKSVDFGALESSGSIPYKVPDAASDLARARRRARTALLWLWIAFVAGSTALWPTDVTVGVMVLIVGLSTVLESIHGALTLDRWINHFQRS
jgi:hypothetical protein